jgi:hypothetical protein
MTSENQIRAFRSRAVIPAGWRLVCIRVLALLLIVLISSGATLAYSVLTH